MNFLETEIETLKEIYPRSLLLYACPSCFKLKPPLLVELNTEGSSTCFLCSRNIAEGEKLLLLEEGKLTNKRNDIECVYTVVRTCKTQCEAPTICKNLKWKSCPNGEECSFAHSDIEKRIWALEWRFGLSRNVIVQRFRYSAVQERKPLKGEFHCVFCLKNFPTGKEFSEHRDSSLLKKLILHTSEIKGKHRPLPDAYILEVCQSRKTGNCKDGDRCKKAHSEAELKEWQDRLQLQKEKLKYANEAGLISFVDSILEEFNKCSSAAEVLNELLPGVKVRIPGDRFRKLTVSKKNPATCKWKLKILCNDSTEKLNHAAFHVTEGARDAFLVCVRRGKRSHAKEHIDFTVLLDDDYSMNLIDGAGNFEVNFKATRKGSFSCYLFLEFRNRPRPVLMIDFRVEVGSFHEDSRNKKPLELNKVPSWERQREIIRVNEDGAEEFALGLKKINNLYKPPSAALDHTAKTANVSVRLFSPDRLNITNYVQEVHSFLYMEEEARNKHLGRPRPFDIVPTKNYMSAERGFSICPEDQLFGLFELPDHLSRDTDAGLLIFESCSKVLISRQNNPLTQPVFEALVEETLIDHIVLLLPTKCIEAWNLQPGRVLKAEIQFQLDRDRFCCCHWAIDQLKASNQLALICPSYDKGFPPIAKKVFPENFRGLDEYQIKVLSFLESDLSKRRANEAMPLLVVQGSFGTGKTHTISKCVKYLLEHDKTAKILICTHSNSAANSYIQNNFSDVQRWQKKVLRVVYHRRKMGTIPSLVKEYCLIEEGRFVYPTVKDVSAFDVFITTFETALSLGQLGTCLGGCFTHIFLDEVAQVMEPVAIIPLTLAHSINTKIVIAGDHIQLTEKIYCKGNAFSSNDADFTLLSRMFKTYLMNLTQFNAGIFDQYLGNYLVVLLKNYRCSPPVLTIIQELFYQEGLLVPCAQVDPVFQHLTAIQFHDVDGRCKSDHLTGGYRNKAEASYIQGLVQKLLLRYGSDLKQKDVVVLTPYREQVKWIREKLRKIGCYGVQVCTVREIQGLEFEIVILSCVHKRDSRENRDGENYGFLADRNMLNTAFTRSKSGIIVVGHAVTLLTLGKCTILWRRYIEMCFRLNGVFHRKDLRSLENEVEAARKKFAALNPFAQEFIPGRIALAGPSNRTESLKHLLHSSSIIEDDEQFQDFGEEEEESLPLKDEILNDIVQNVIGIKSDKLTVKVDASGIETATEQSKSNENDLSFDIGTDNGHRNFTLGQLNELLAKHSQDYKKCTLYIKNWHSATALLHEPEPNLMRIRINTKRNLGHAFDQDEVVVHIEKKVIENDSADEEEKMTVYGKVVGITSKYRNPLERKFICFPDPYNPGFMCPVDRKITKFVIRKKDKSEDNVDLRHGKLKIPIGRLEKDENGKEHIKTIRFVNYDRFSMTLQTSKHFVVRFIKWLPNCLYPIGYVSEEIKPKDYEKYYSMLHDVPNLKHDKAVEKQANQLANKKLDQPRRDLEHLFVFTIDPEGSTDLDDAISVEKCKEHQDCWEIGIHIADVASVIPADSDVDLEARKRGTSFYSGDVSKDKNRETIHMLPQALSSERCSLLPDGQKKPAISVFLHSSILPVITSTNHNESKALNLPTPQLTYVTSKCRLTYREAELALRQVREHGFQGLSESSEDTLAEQLYILWQTMLKLRFQRISWSSFHNEPDFKKFNEFCDDASAHMLIEEAMITCNSCCSHYLQNEGCDFLLRIQNPPSPDVSEKWRETNMLPISLSLHLQECVQHLHGEEKLTKIEETVRIPKNISIFPDVWMKIEDALKRSDLETALILFSSDKLQPALSPGKSRYIRIQVKSQYQTQSFVSETNTPGCVTHFSMRLPLYSRFTSPIRRYVDLYSQRLILEKLSSDKKSLEDPKVLQISKPAPLNLKELAKKLNQRDEDEKNNEKDVRMFSYAFSLAQEQNYEVASITAMEENGVRVNFPDLKDLPWNAFLLRFSDLKLHEKTKENMTWRIRYFKAEGGQSSETGSVFHKFHTKTVVSAKDWNALLGSAKSLAFDSEEPMNERAKETLKSDFEKVLKSRKVLQICKRAKSAGPCDNQDCRKRKFCNDHLDGRSKLGINHYRVIKMPLTLGTPMLLQLHCGVRHGICTPSIQLLAVAQDLDICAAHNRHPVETFAADVRPVEGKEFHNIEEYIDHWHPLLLMEAIYNAVNDNNNSTVTIQNVSVNFHDTVGRLRGTFSLLDQFCRRRAIEIDVDDFVCVRVKYFDRNLNKGAAPKVGSHKASFTWVVHGKICSVKEESKNDQALRVCNFIACTSLVAKPKIPDAILSKGRSAKATVELIQLGLSHRGFVDSLRAAADLCEQQEIVPSLCLNEEVGAWRVSSGAQRVIDSVGQTIVPGMKSPLNKGQIKQICRALQSKIALIQGPPGTGKSFVGAHLTYYFHQINTLKQNGATKILYCGPSNQSVDVVAEYLLNSNLKVLRVYGSTFEEEDFPNPLKPGKTGQASEKKPSQKIKDITLHCIIRNKNKPFAKQISKFDSKFTQSHDISYHEYREYKELLGKAKLKEFQNHDVIVCTCAAATIFRKSLITKEGENLFQFAQCIIDECGMCSEPETLAPIVASQADQIVLIGDHKQLQPVILCPTARRLGLQLSLFERKNEESGMLIHQYRMDPRVCDFPSQHFYDGALATDQSVLDRERKNSFHFRYPRESENSAVFCHVEGKEQANHSAQRGGESSYDNEKEAEVVLKILLYLRRKNVSLSSIMILSPYRAQVTTIKELIVKERSQFKDVHVGTVVTSQGSESDFVILSTVRSRPSSAIEDQANVQWRRKFIGFVSDPHQINVAITRAKSGLCIVGNQNLLEKDTETWSKLLDDYRRRGSVVSCNDPAAPWNS